MNEQTHHPGLWPVPGEGVLARQDDLILLSSLDDYNLADTLLDLLVKVAASGADGRQFCDLVADALDVRAASGGADSPGVVAFGPAGAGVAVTVTGEAWAEVRTAHGVQRVQAGEPGMLLRCVLRSPVLFVRAGLGADGNTRASTDRFSRLDGGTIRAGGLAFYPAGSVTGEAGPVPELVPDAGVGGPDEAPAAAVRSPYEAPAIGDPGPAVSDLPPRDRGPDLPAGAHQPQVMADLPPAVAGVPEAMPDQPQVMADLPPPVAEMPGAMPDQPQVMVEMPPDLAERPAAPDPSPATPEQTAFPADQAPPVDLPDQAEGGLAALGFATAAPAAVPSDQWQPFDAVLLTGGAAADPAIEAEPRAPLPGAAEVLRDPTIVASGPIIQGVYCKNGHFDDPEARYCAVCGISMNQQTLVPRPGPRPPLGVLVMDDGSVFQLDQDYVLGREPTLDASVASGVARPLRIRDDNGIVSRVHARVHLDGWHVVLTDLGSANGTRLLLPGQPADAALQPQAPVALVPGSQVDLGGRGFRYESHRGR